MKINDGIRELWKEGFFEEHSEPNKIKQKLKDKFGMNPSNITMNLKSCSKILRKERNGWIQKIRYSVKVNSKEKLASRPITLYDVATDSKLLKSCESNYKSGNDWDMVFNALRHMETRVRKKGSFSPSEVGADLMEKAFKPVVGVLKVPTCATPGEEDGFKLITKGMMMFHRNAKGHREETIDRALALKIIGYVDYLLKIIDTTEKREN